MAERWNIKYFAPTFLPAFEFMGNKRIASVADMKGVKMRIAGLNAKALQAFGAVPTMVTAPEGYEALQRGTIDSFGFPYSFAFGAYKLHEVSKFATEGMAMSGFLCFQGVSLTAWNKLPDNLKAKLPEAQELASAALLKAFKADDEKWIPLFKQKLEVVQFPPRSAPSSSPPPADLGGLGQGAGGGGPARPGDPELRQSGSRQVHALSRPGGPVYELAILAIVVVALMAVTTFVAGLVGRALRVVEYVLLIGSILVILFVMFFVGAEVLMRYAFDTPIPGHLELSELMAPIIVFLALSYTQATHGHVGMDLVLDSLPPGGRRYARDGDAAHQHLHLRGAGLLQLQERLSALALRRRHHVAALFQDLAVGGGHPARLRADLDPDVHPVSPPLRPRPLPRQRTGSRRLPCGRIGAARTITPHALVERTARRGSGQYRHACRSLR